jgi:DNA-binding IscR family transcriptional regulator
MGGLYMVWLTILFGAQVAYAFQNRASYLQEKLADNVNQRGREFVALRLMTCIGQRFHRGSPPVTIREISAELGIPGKLAQQVLHTLLAARLVVEVSGPEAGYAPARPLESINTHHILLAMRATQGQELVTRDEPVRIEVLGEFARIQDAEREAASRVTMLALVNRAQARLELALPTDATVKSQPEATSQLVTTLTEEGLIEEAPVASDEGAVPPAPIEVTPKVNFNPTSPSIVPPANVEPKPKTAANAAPTAPLASSTTNENESFPL